MSLLLLVQCLEFNFKTEINKKLNTSYIQKFQINFEKVEYCLYSKSEIAAHFLGSQHALVGEDHTEGDSPPHLLYYCIMILMVYCQLVLICILRQIKHTLVLEKTIDPFFEEQRENIHKLQRVLHAMQQELSKTKDVKHGNLEHICRVLISLSLQPLLILSIPSLRHFSGISHNFHNLPVI